VNQKYIQEQMKILEAARERGSPLTPEQRWKFADKMASSAGMTAPSKPKGPEIQLTLFGDKE